MVQAASQLLAQLRSICQSNLLDNPTLFTSYAKRGLGASQIL